VKKSLQSKRIEWFLDFINQDLSILAEDNRMKLINNIESIIYGMGEIVFEGKTRPDMPSGRWDDIISHDSQKILQQKGKLEAYQLRLKEFFNSILQKFSEAKKQTESYHSDPKNYFCLENIDLSDLKLKVELPLIEDANPKVENDKYLIRLDEKSLMAAPIRLSYRASSDEVTLLYYFIKALEGVPASAFRQCPDCLKFFLHLSKRIKKYCSNKCASRSGVRKRRE